MAKKEKGKKGVSPQKKKRKTVLRLVIWTSFIFLGALTLHGIITSGPPSYPFGHHLKGPNHLTSEELQKASSAHVLLIGDQNAAFISSQIAQYLQKISSSLKQPLQFSNWSKDNLSLYRHLVALKELKKWPSLIIYMVDESQFYEALFEDQDMAAIENNLAVSKEKWRSSMMMIWPPLARFFYRDITSRELSTLAPKKASPLKEWPIRKMLLGHELYHQQLEELIDLARVHESRLLLITLPINVFLPPKSSCTKADSPSLEKALNQAKDYLLAGKSKDALALLQEIKPLALSNAKAFFLLGQAYWDNGQFALAKEAYSMASGLDCWPYRPSPLSNAMARQLAQKNSLELIDFDRDLYQAQGQSPVFLSAHRPGPFYYQQLMDKIRQSISRHFKMAF